MKFGKLQDISGVNFSLPPDPAANSSRLAEFRLPPDETPSVYLGATGWSMPVWRGKWYPAKAKPVDYLRHFGAQMTTIELNTTHYRIPDAATVARWYGAVPADFRFCPKVPQRISHAGDLDLGGDVLKTFLAAIVGLDEKMGCCFIQLPPYFGPDKLPLLRRWLGAWPRSVPLAVEVRQPDWFVDPAVMEKLMDTLYEFGTAAVITDVAGRRDVLHQYITAPRIMLRLVGNGLVDSDYVRSRNWIDRLLEWNLPENYIFPHQPDNLLSPDLIAWITQELQARNPDLATRGPKLDPGEPQMSLF